MKCDSCGAPIENGKCTYCGKIFTETPKTNVPYQNNTYVHINNYPGQKNPVKPQKKKKSGCGTILWIFIILMIIGGIVSLFSSGSSSSDSSSDATSNETTSSVWASDYAPIDDFDYYVDGNELYLKDYNGHDKKIRINNMYTIDGTDYNVVSLDGTFTLTRVDSVYVPEGVTYVSNNVFNSCGIQFVYLPSTLTEISNSFLSYFHDMDKIYYGGTEEQWNSLVTEDRSSIEAKQIVFNTDPINNSEVKTNTSNENTTVTINNRLMELGYTSDQADAVVDILKNVGISDAEDMWNINQNGTLQANALTYNGHQVNFTTDNNELFYVEITGWDEEISHYGWYQSSWSGKLKYGYNTENKITTVDLYAVNEDGTGGYLAVYDITNDSVHPYEE